VYASFLTFYDSNVNGLQGDIPEVNGRNEKTKQRNKQREHGVGVRAATGKNSIVFSLMYSWRTTNPISVQATVV
jgi:hypothetical protein